MPNRSNVQVLPFLSTSNMQHCSTLHSVQSSDATVGRVLWHAGLAGRPPRSWNAPRQSRHQTDCFADYCRRYSEKPWHLHQLTSYLSVMWLKWTPPPTLWLKRARDITTTDSTPQEKHWNSACILGALQPRLKMALRSILFHLCSPLKGKRYMICIWLYIK